MKEESGSDMKRILVLLISVMFILCGCKDNANLPNESTVSEQETQASVVGKWVDVKTEKIFEYTEDGFYYEYLNESFTSDKTRYIAKDGKITYYLDGDTPDLGFSVDYEIKNGHLIINGVIEYKPVESQMFPVETE